MDPETPDTNTALQTANPFASNGGQVATRPANALVQVEAQRAIAEVQARMMIARANPRNPVACVDALLQDCMRPSLAEHAVYQYARGGTDIEGPSIRLAEAIARRWGNIASGIKEVSRSAGYSECVAYAWDLETGYYDERQFQVRHWRDTKKGGYQINDERDIYELVANMGQRRKRAVLLSVIPGDVVEAAVHQCGVTLNAKADTSAEGMQKMVEAFKPFGVTREQIEKRIQRRIDAITPAQVVGLKKVYASLRDGMSVAGDWFEAAEQPAGNAAGGTTPSATDALKDKLRGAKPGKDAKAPDSAPPAAAAAPADTQPTNAANSAPNDPGASGEPGGPSRDDCLGMVGAGQFDEALDAASGTPWLPEIKAAIEAARQVKPLPAEPKK